MTLSNSNHFTKQFDIFRSFSALPTILLVLTIYSTGITHSFAQTPANVTIPTGSFIINMGIVPQTVGNGLKPYGLVYALLNAKCPVDWVINTSKSKDGVDFTYNGVQYKGGTFIIEATYRTAAINTIITTWQGLGVQGVTTTSPVTVPLYLTFWNVPRWTMDKQNGGIATAFFANAGIPATAYGGSSTYWKTPAQLDCCDDIFVMPHADPIWSTHRHLLEWNSSSGNGTTSGCKSGVWLGCHAGSALMDMFDNITTDGDPINYNEQTNFLVDITGPATGTGPWAENALLLWGNHDDGTLPYAYDYHGEPIMQFMGTIDAAQQNGSEQIYIPMSAGWFSNTHVGVYDPDHPDRYPGVAPYTGYTDPKHRAATLAYGPGFGITGNGKVMLEGAHNISGTAPANVAAQRAFFNYSYLVAWEKAVLPSLTGLPDTIYSGNSYPLSYSEVPNIPPATPSAYTTLWSSSCGGTWNPNNTSASTTFIAPTVTGATACAISVTITDACGRTTFDTHNVTVMPCKLTVAATVTPPSCFGGSNGSIAMTITGGTGPYNYTWTRTNPAGSGSGSNPASPFTISGLSAGTYSITVTNTNNCTGTATVLVTQPAQITATTVVTNAACYGSTSGSVNLTVAGGTAPYTYLWTPGNMTTEDLANVPAGTYNVTVTDSKGCTATATAIVGQPGGGLAVTGITTNVSCYGTATGAIDITATGGTAPYTYNWSDLPGTNDPEDRTALAQGTYNVTVTDANGCTATLSKTITQPAALSLSVAITPPTCAVINTTYTTYDGAINLTVSGGTGPFTYDWADLTPPPAEPEDRTALAPGTYSVTVTDAKGCTATLSNITLVNTSTTPGSPTIINH